jgi:RNA-binding protein
MDDISLTALTGAERSRLRGLGQTLEPALKVGRGGLTPEFYTELGRLFADRDLVKLRFLGADRPTRAQLIAHITSHAECVLAGAVGHTALFYRPKPATTVPVSP